MGDKDSCIQATNDYIKTYNEKQADFIARYKAVQKQNDKINAENNQNEKKYKSDMAAYETQQRAVRKQDTGNLSGCGTLTDASDVWVLDSWSQDNVFSKFACSYKYTDVQINRLLDIWKNKNAFVPKKLIHYPTQEKVSLTIQCCSNRIDLTDAVMAAKALENVHQICNESITNNGGNGGNGGNGDSQNNDPDSDVDNSGTQIDNSSTKKIIIIIIICVVLLFIVLGIIGLVFFLKNNKKKIIVKPILKS